MNSGTSMMMHRLSLPAMLTGRSPSWRTAASVSACGASLSSNSACRCLTHLRRDPFEKAQHNSNTYEDWFLDRPFVIVPVQGIGRAVPDDHEGISAEPARARLI